MSDKLERNLIGSISTSQTLTGTISVGRVSDKSQVYILEDENGTQVTAFLTDEEIVLNATENDIRIGTTAVTDKGVVTGEKEIPVYITREGRRLITKGSKVELYIPMYYNYKRLQAIICAYNTTIDNSVSTEKVVINDNLYDVLSAEPIAKIINDSDNARIDFGIKNESSSHYILRYFMYTEEY